MQKTFTATKWNTAEDKEKFFKHFQKFVSSGYKWTLFPKWFYTRLSMTFGHIAHYDRAGFYSTFFQDAAGIEQFARMTMGATCYGDPDCTYSDVETAIQQHYRGYSDIHFVEMFRQTRNVCLTEGL